MARKKHVFSTIGEVCHTWAHDWRERGNGRTSNGNVYFQQSTIYSYGAHFPMAKFTESSDGETVVLINSDDYSVSTGNHKRNVESAVSHYKTFEVPNVEAETDRDHFANWEYLRTQLNVARNELARRRDLQPHSLNWADRAATIANNYAAVFSVKGLEPHQFPLVAYSEIDRAAIMLKIDRDAENREIRRIEAEAKNARDTKARIEAEAIRDAAQSRLELYERITFGLYKAPRPQWKYGYQSNRSTAKPSRDKLKEIAAKVTAWKRGESNARFPYGYSGPVVMRIDADRENARTSQNAVFPVADCVSIWPAIKLAKDSGTRNDNPDAKLGMYRVNHIDASGNVKAGCHDVTFAECRKLAIMLEIETPTMAERITFKARKLIK